MGRSLEVEILKLFQAHVAHGKLYNHLIVKLDEMGVHFSDIFWHRIKDRRVSWFQDYFYGFI